MDEKEKREILDWLNDDDEPPTPTEESRGEDELFFVDTVPETELTFVDEDDADENLQDQSASEEEPPLKETSLPDQAVVVDDEQVPEKLEASAMTVELDEGDEDELDRRSATETDVAASTVADSDQVEPQSEVYNEPQSEVYNEPQSEVYNEPQSEVYNEPQSEVYNEPQSEVYNEPQSEVYNEPQSEVYNEPQSEVYNEPQSEEDNETESEAFSEGQSEAFSEGQSEGGSATPSKKAAWDLGRMSTLTSKLAVGAAAARASANKSTGDLSSRATAMGAKMKSSLTGAFGRKAQSRTSADARGEASANESAAGMFSIDDEEDEEEDEEHPGSPSQPRPQPDPAALALAQHKIAGLQKGQAVVFDSVNLPDTVLFSAIKLKPANTKTSKMMAGFHLSPLLPERKLIRCIAVNRERLLVFDTFDQSVKFGGKAIVKSNHHLTELVKITFPRTREKDVVAIHLRHGATDGALALKSNTYKVPRAESLITQLQERLARFR